MFLPAVLMNFGRWAGTAIDIGEAKVVAQCHMYEFLSLSHHLREEIKRVLQT